MSGNQYIDESFLQKVLRNLKAVSRELHQYGKIRKEFGVSAANMKLKKALRMVSASEYVSFIYSAYEKEILPVLNDYNTHWEEKISKLQENKIKTDKTPIWVCWFQGKETLPDICKACINRMEEIKPENSEIVLLTNENYLDYVSFPREVVEKYNAGLIGMANYSDIIRHYLLSRYGGAWIDAAIFLSNNVLNRLFEYDLYSPKFSDGKEFDGNASRGMWCLGFWATKEISILSNYVYDCLIAFWQKHDIALEYLACDYIIMLLYENNEYVKKLIDDIPIITKDNRELNYHFSEPFSQELWDELMSKSDIHFLNRHFDYPTKTQDGKKTIYGHMLEITGVI